MIRRFLDCSCEINLELTVMPLTSGQGELLRFSLNDDHSIAEDHQNVGLRNDFLFNEIDVREDVSGAEDRLQSIVSELFDKCASIVGRLLLVKGVILHPEKRGLVECFVDRVMHEEKH
ncbi:hypothetical protein PSPTOT1_2839 [Pseudomonas syringae pv. tomato T1]|nr:hypothetical protein PSPTOT1_2839 [Pseudomonas syringae pv. tomato T1]